MKKLLASFVALMACVMASAQVTFSSELVTKAGSADAEIVFTGKISPGWHVYSTDLGEDGPISATFTANSLDGVELVGKLTPEGTEVTKHDNLFDMDLRWFEGTAKFVQKVRFTKTNYSIDGYLEYGACNDQNCLPPSQCEIKQQGTAPATASVKAKTTTPAKKAKAKKKASRRTRR